MEAEADVGYLAGASLMRAFCLISCCLSLACSDARGAYEAFGARADQAEQDDAGTDAGPCVPPSPGAISGRALIAVGTSISPGRPILFLGDLETPELDGKTAVTFVYRPLDASDRKTEVGNVLSLGPFGIEDDGSFVAPTGEATLPGEANALLPGVPITSDLTLHGTICGVERFYCGTVTGEASYPVMGPIEGDFGLELVGDELPENPRYGCAEEDVALPLE
jgi:hypothetical protein